MGEQSEYYRAAHDLRRHQRAEQFEENMRVLRGTDLKWDLRGGHTVCVRDPRYPFADFYPSTGRFRFVGGNVDRKTRGGGGAGAFMKVMDQARRDRSGN